jgi:membrane-associated phospholipid phosphatase
MPVRARTAALGAFACVVLLAIVWFAASHIGFFGHADQSIYQQFGDLQAHSRVERVAGWLVSWFDPNPYVYLVVAVVAVAVLRRRPRAVFAVCTIVLGATVSTELLKHVVAAPRPGYLFAGGYSPLPPDSWPSGHSTAVMALVLAAVVAAPARLRPAVAALGACLAIAVGYSVLATGIHYPSDVLGGFLMAATWALATVAALLGVEDWRPSPGGRRRERGERVSVRAALSAPGAVLLAAIVLALIVLITRPHDVESYARAHGAFVAGALAIGALGLALSTGVLLSVRR